MKNIKDTVFIIQARLSSTRIPKKMIKPFNSSTIFDISIQKILSSNVIPKEQFYVSIYDEELIKIAEKYNINIFERTKESSTWDNKNDGELKNMYEWCRLPYKYYVLLNPCFPFLNTITIDNFVKSFLETNKNGLFGVIDKKNYFWNNNSELITKWPEGEECMNTKLVENTYEAGHCLYGGKMDDILKGIQVGDFKDNSTFDLFPISPEECLDIDYNWEFRLCEAFHKRQNLKVVIHSNLSNKLIALIAKYSFQKHNPFIDVKITIVEEDFKDLLEYDGQSFIRGSRNYDCYWYKDTSQSFFPTRFMVPEYFNYEGILLIIDPDIFLVKKLDTDILKNYILEKDIAACININNLPASSVMLLYADKFKKWSSKNILNSIFNKKEDFDNLMYLKKEYDKNEISILPPEYNHFDEINEDTILLHTTKTETQPWKYGIKYKKSELHNMQKNNKEENLIFQKHANEKVENFFFKIAKESYEKNIINDSMIKEAIKNKWIRSDFFDKMLEQ